MREVSVLTTTVIHRNVAVCTMTVVVCYTMPTVMQSWSVVHFKGILPNLEGGFS